jgi:hypothetical protein
LKDASPSDGVTTTAVLGDVDQIRNRVALYSWLLDAGDSEGLEELFQHAVVTQIGAPPWRGRRLRGDEEAESARSPWDSAWRPKQHVISSQLVELETADTARVRSYYTVFCYADDSRIVVGASGRYDDRLDRIDGRWEFTERRYHLDLVGDLGAVVEADDQTVAALRQHAAAAQEERRSWTRSVLLPGARRAPETA